MSEKIRIILKRKGITLTELAQRMDISRQNLNNKINRDNFTQDELHKIAALLEIKYESNFILEDGTKI